MISDVSISTQGVGSYSVDPSDFPACKFMSFFGESLGATTPGTVTDLTTVNNLTISGASSLATIWGTKKQITLNNVNNDFAYKTDADTIAIGLNHLLLFCTFTSPSPPSLDQGLICYGKSHSAGNPGFEWYLSNSATLPRPNFRARATDDTTTTVLASPWLAGNYCNGTTYALAVFWDRTPGSGRLLGFKDGGSLETVSGVADVSSITIEGTVGLRIGNRGFNTDRDFNGGIMLASIWSFSSLPSDLVIASAVEESFIAPYEFPQSLIGLV